MSFAQTIKVSGTVTDSSNEPVIGVSVLVKGTTTGTSTDLDDVVVTGYMTEKKKDITGSVAIVKKKEVADIPTGNVMTALNGRDEYLPIPLTQYNLSKGAYTQNPGYAAF